MRTKIALIELNEVPWRVIERFTDAHPSSALSRAVQRGKCFTTITPDRQLSPWTTWSTVHRGVPDTAHGILDFGQELADVNERYQPLWSFAARAGLAVGNVGSLHTFPLPGYLDSCAFWVPDAFASSHECKPAEVEIFQEINLKMSRESGRNVSRRIPADLATRLLIRAPRLGITAGTAARVTAQLASELASPRRKSRRRTLQSILAFDIFHRLLERTRPDFCSFFTNNVASAMHRYWAATFPHDYVDNTYEESWRAAFRDDIDWAMTAFDRMLARLLAFVDRTAEYSLWIASSMGQSAVESSQVTRQVLLTDVARFMTALGFRPGEWERRPAMEPRVIVKVPQQRSEEFERLARSIRIAGTHSIGCTNLEQGVFRLHPGAIMDTTRESCELDGQSLPFGELGFANVVIEDEAGQSAYHVPQGILIVYSSTRSNADFARTEVSTLEIAPAILRTLGIRPAPYMVETRIM